MPAPSQRSSALTDLDVCRLSAEALGHEAKTKNHPELGKIVTYGGTTNHDWCVWNPLTNAKQRWECVEWLLKQNKDSWISLDSGNVNTYDWVAANEDHIVQIECPTAEFPARAVAELQRRKHD